MTRPRRDLRWWWEWLTAELRFLWFVLVLVRRVTRRHHDYEWALCYSCSEPTRIRDAALFCTNDGAPHLQCRGCTAIHEWMLNGGRPTYHLPLRKYARSVIVRRAADVARAAEARHDG